MHGLHCMPCQTLFNFLSNVPAGVESEEQEARALQQAALGGQEEHRLIQQKVSAFREQIAIQEQDCVAQEDCECSMFYAQPCVMHS